MHTSVKVIRGREASKKAEMHNAGWEFISQTDGVVRTELTFRRVKPKSIGDRLKRIAVTGFAAFRRLEPTTQRRALLAGGGVLLALVLFVGIAIAVGGGDDEKTTSAASTESAQPSDSPSEPSPSESGAESPGCEPDICRDTVADSVPNAN